MEQERIKDIKDGLECLSGHKPCNLCSYHELAEMQETCCINVVAEDVIDYIYELESENKKLSAKYKNLENNYEYTHKVYREYEEENKQLKDRIAVLESIGLNEDITVGEYLQDMQRLKDKIAELEKEKKENNSYAKGYADGIKNTYEAMLPQKLKQFVERLKEKLKEKVNADNVDAFVDCKKIINKTLKEFE